MTKRGRGKESTLEIVVAIAVVIFVFSLIGLLNLNPISKPFENKIAEPEKVVAQDLGRITTENAATINNAVTVSVKTIPLTGTELSSSSSSFEIKTK